MIFNRNGGERATDPIMKEKKRLEESVKKKSKSLFAELEPALFPDEEKPKPRRERSASFGDKSPPLDKKGIASLPNIVARIRTSTNPAPSGVKSMNSSPNIRGKHFPLKEKSHSSLSRRTVLRKLSKPLKVIPQKLNPVKPIKDGITRVRNFFNDGINLRMIRSEPDEDDTHIINEKTILSGDEDDYEDFEKAFNDFDDEEQISPIVKDHKEKPSAIPRPPSFRRSHSFDGLDTLSSTGTSQNNNEELLSVKMNKNRERMKMMKEKFEEIVKHYSREEKAEWIRKMQERENYHNTQVINLREDYELRFSELSQKLESKNHKIDKLEKQLTKTNQVIQNQFMLSRKEVEEAKAEVLAIRDMIKNIYNENRKVNAQTNAQRVDIEDQLSKISVVEENMNVLIKSQKKKAKEYVYAGLALFMSFLGFVIVIVGSVIKVFLLTKNESSEDDVFTKFFVKLERKRASYEKLSNPSHRFVEIDAKINRRKKKTKPVEKKEENVVIEIEEKDEVVEVSRSLEEEEEEDIIPQKIKNETFLLKSTSGELYDDIGIDDMNFSITKPTPVMKRRRVLSNIDSRNFGEMSNASDSSGSIDDDSGFVGEKDASSTSGMMTQMNESTLSGFSDISTTSSLSGYDLLKSRFKIQ